MKKWKKEVIYVLVVGMMFSVLTFYAWVKPSDEFSATERRKLAQFPEVTMESVKNGLWMTKLESYMIDQFPLRDAFRTWKALTYKYILGQKDNQDVYVKGDMIGKLEYPYEPEAVNAAYHKFYGIYETYMKDTDVNLYTALIPDKNYFLTRNTAYPSVDYERLYEDYQDAMKGFADYIELRDDLEIEDYYRTDTHWRQENIQKIATRLAEEMGVQLKETYHPVTLEIPFYGVYYGQAALPVQPDTMTYMDHSLFSECRVYDHQNQKEMSVYDLELAAGRDSYEMFLGGSLSVITIENPNASTDKELVIFRDSFGSSITPYFIEGYAKITMLDARYLHESLIGNYVTFSNQDILFLHSTSVINNLSAFK